MPLYHLALQHKKPTQIVWAYIHQNPFAPEEKRIPALSVYAVPTSPVADLLPATLFSSAAFIPACGFAVSALI